MRVSTQSAEEQGLLSKAAAGLGVVKVMNGHTCVGLTIRGSAYLVGELTSSVSVGFCPTVVL